MDEKIKFARELRHNSTPQEQKMWNLLRNNRYNGLKFRRQYVIGEYIVDFVCQEKMLIIEVDGGQHNKEDNIKYDKERTEYLESIGYTVIRFWNNDIRNNLQGVYEVIQQNLL